MDVPGASQSSPIPDLNRNPIRSLRPAPVVFTVGGQEFVIPALPAVDWLESLMQEDWTPEDIFLDLLPNGVMEYMNFNASEQEIFHLVADILEEVSARRWWIALTVVAIMKSKWTMFGAEAITQGIDPEKLSLAAWLDAVSVLIYKAIPTDSQAMFLARLEMPPPGFELPEEEMETSRDQFLSMMND